MNNIALIGMMGSGKSTIGKILSQNYSNYNFVDTDDGYHMTQSTCPGGRHCM